MNKIKLYLIIGAVLFVAASVVTVNVQSKIIKKRNETIDRLRYNESELLKDNDNLVRLELTQKELTGKLVRERDSLAGVLKVRPKTIEKIVIKEIKQIDTVTEFIPVIQKTDTSWAFSDVRDCFTYKGTFFVTPDSIYLQRNYFGYQNKIDEVYYYKRKFPIFGKKRYYQESVAQCDASVKTTEITIRKK